MHCVLWAIEMNIYGFVPSIIIKTVAANKMKRPTEIKKRQQQPARATIVKYFKRILLHTISYSNEFLLIVEMRSVAFSFRLCSANMSILVENVVENYGNYGIITTLFASFSSLMACSSLHSISNSDLKKKTRKEEGDEKAEEKNVQHIYKWIDSSTN